MGREVLQGAMRLSFPLGRIGPVPGTRATASLATAELERLRVCHQHLGTAGLTGAPGLPERLVVKFVDVLQITNPQLFQL